MLVKFYVISAVLFKLISAKISSNSSTRYLQYLDNILKRYDRRQMPTSDLNISTTATIELYVRSISSINPITMDYTVDLYVRQRWNDHRLRNPFQVKVLDFDDPEVLQTIWKPEIFFPNAKIGYFQLVTVPNFLLRISPEGNIMYMLRLKMTFSCMMELYKYPMDTQVCSVEISSFSKTVDELELIWYKEDPIVLYKNVKLPQFKIIKVEGTKCREVFTIGEYSCLKADFYLRRSYGYHIVETYIPTVLIVAISWVSFWLEPNALAPRTTLGVTTLLTITAKGSAVQSILPPVSYVKAIDVWIGGCTSFVFAAVIEFTLVSYLWNKEIMKEVTPEEVKLFTTEGEIPKKGILVTVWHLPYYKILAKRIDRLSSFCFPLLFITFNICYWSYYLL